MSRFTNVLLVAVSATLLGACSTQEKTDDLTRSVSRSQVIEQGVPGSITTEFEKVSAVVSAINLRNRTFTLRDAQGNQRTLEAAPEMLNFAQLKVGDQVTATVGVERVIFLRDADAARADDGAVGVLLTAPEGEKPAMFKAKVLEVTALVKSIDTTRRTATLAFADGTQKVVAVRPDIELKKDYLNRQVVIRMTVAVAVSVEAQ
jgi:hypothetical protein